MAVCDQLLKVKRSLVAFKRCKNDQAIGIPWAHGYKIRIRRCLRPGGIDPIAVDHGTDAPTEKKITSAARSCGLHTLQHRRKILVGQCTLQGGPACQDTNGWTVTF